jgi:hypothetical protein
VLVQAFLLTSNMSTAAELGRQAPSSQKDWTRSDEYHNSFLISKDEALEEALTQSREEGLPDISVSAAQGKFLKLLALSIGAKRILEVGTLGGCANISFHQYEGSDSLCRYSTIWLAQALPEDGKLITFELSEKHAKVTITTHNACSNLISFWTGCRGQYSQCGLHF